MALSTLLLSPEERRNLPLPLLDSMDQVLVAVDPDGQIVFWNLGAQKAFGWREPEVLGRPLAEVLASPALAQTLSDHTPALLAGNRWFQQFVVTCRAGDVLTLGLGFWVIPLGAKPLIGIIGPSPDQSGPFELNETNRFLTAAGELLLSTLDYEESLKTLVNLVVPQVADWCAVHLLNADGSVEQVALAPHGLTQIQAVEEWLQTALPRDEVDGLPAVFRTGKPKLVTSGNSHAMAAATIQSYMIVPLKALPQTIGAVTFVTAESGRRLNLANLAVAENLASHIAVSMEKSRLFRKSQELNLELEQRVDARTVELLAAVHQLKSSEATLQTLFRFSNKLNSTLDIQMIVQELALEAIRVVGADGGFAGLCTPEGMTCHQFFRGGLSFPFVHRWESGEGIPGWVLENRVPYGTSEAGLAPEVDQGLPLYSGVQSILCTPIINSQGLVLGYFEVHHKRCPQDGTGENQAKLLNLAPVASIAIQNALAFQQRLSDLIDLKEASQQLRALAAKLESAREEERTRIARDLHDELGQALTAMKFDLAWLSERLAKRDAELAVKAKAVTTRMDLMVKTVRRISTELRPGMLDDLGLAASLEWLARDFEKDKRIRCTVQVTGSQPSRVDVPATVALAVFRVFQEALTNVTRHSGARSVEVGLILGDHDLVLRVHDDGRGISHREIHGRKTLGLLGMKERIHRLGGGITFVGSAEVGTVITVTIPWEIPHD